MVGKQTNVLFYDCFLVYSMPCDRNYFFTCVCTQVLIVDDNSERVAHARIKIGLFEEEKIQFVSSID